MTAVLPGHRPHTAPRAEAGARTGHDDYRERICRTRGHVAREYGMWEGDRR
ncbi:hypothetical protein AB0L57_01710 [Nocardia sp. NPDC052254]|uniref:hypothetical protein n=1 Tax=Nocardia sp. NPDC052254 TaxID=3155681 RepID=UPI00341E2596